MQTFLPSPSFAESASILDRQRLGKQRVEVLQIINSLTRDNGFSAHPAVIMWKGHRGCLLTYGRVMCLEWIERGYNDSLHAQFREMSFPDEVDNPPWLLDDRLIRSHRSNLLRKDPVWYGRFDWEDVPRDLPYFWPSREGY